MKSERFPLALRLALRDLRGGLAGFRIFIACIVLGVTAIVGVGSTARSLLDSLAREGQQILGGDVSFTTVLRELSTTEREWIGARGNLSEIAGMRAMARKSDNAVLVEIKAVDSTYPAIGRVILSPPDLEIQQALRLNNGAYGLAGDETLRHRLSLNIGDTIMIGDAKFMWRGTVNSEPDKLAGGFSLGPRVMISMEALRASGLIQPGSLLRWTYRIALPQQRNPSGLAPASKSRIDEFVKGAEAAFPEAGWRVATRDRISPNFAKNLERFSQFLTLVGLTALIIGGIGVANAVRGFVNRKRSDFAVLKAIGASGSYVFLVSMIEVMIATAVGVAIGIAIGIILPFAVAGFFGTIIPVPFIPSIYFPEILLGAAYGFLAAAAFSLAPLGYVHDTPVSALFRDSLNQDKRSLRPTYKVLIGLAAILFVAVVLLTATDRRSAIIYLVASSLILGSLQIIGLLLGILARRMPRRGGTEWRLAVANLGRPGALTRPVIASVGLGLSLFVTLSVIDSNIREPLQHGIPGQTPSFFFTDIRSAQADSFAAFVKQKIPEAKLEMVPMLRGRVVRFNDSDVKTIRAKENVAWVLEGDRGITFAAEVPAGSNITAGQWWPEKYSGPPLVSVESEAADGLGLKLGDDVTLNILGRNVTAKIANFREVNWRSFGINFVFVLTPSTFVGVPHTWLATATFTEAGSDAAETQLVSAVATAFPTVSAIRLKETFEAVAAIARQLGIAIRSATVVALLASILVLAGALAAGQSARLYDTIVLKVLGASRRRLIGALFAEFLILGLTTALFAVLAGTATAWVILTRVLMIDNFAWDWQGGIQTALISLGIVVSLGIAGTWKVLGQRPARNLRER